MAATHVARTGLLVLLLAGLSGLNEAAVAGQAPVGQNPPVSLDRVRAGVEKPSTLEVNATSMLPVTTFRTTVDQTQFVLTFEEWLRNEFEPTELQRQSSDWGSKCCGIGLGTILKPIGRALKNRREQKIRERIARELEALRTAAGRR